LIGRIACLDSHECGVRELIILQAALKNRHHAQWQQNQKQRNDNE
jgi:hypothetical protein